MPDNFTDDALTAICMLISDAESVTHTHILSQLLEELRVKVRSSVGDDDVSMPVETPIFPDSICQIESSDSFDRFQEYQLSKEINYDINVRVSILSWRCDLNRIYSNNTPAVRRF